MTSPTRTRRAGRVLGLVAVVTGAMVLSYRGQVAAVGPMLGPGLGSVLALTLDAATLLALHEVLASTRGSSIRRWAWSVLLLAGGISLGLNTWHALAAGTLPVPAGVAVGAGPVVLAGLVSHLLALSIGTGDVPSGTSQVPGPIGTAPVVPPTPAGTGTAYPVGTAGSVTTATGTDPVSADRACPAPPVRSVRPARPEPVTSSPEELPPAARALWDQARELNTAHHAEHGSPMPRRVLMDRLGCGTTTATALRSALEATADTSPAGTDGSTGTGGPSGTSTARPADTDGPPASAGVGTDAGLARPLSLVPSTAPDR